MSYVVKIPFTIHNSSFDPLFLQAAAQLKRSAAKGNVHMKKWPDKLRLLTILATTKVLLSRSENEGWGLEYPKEAEQQIDQILDCLYFDSDKPLPPHWQVLYAPTQRGLCRRSQSQTGGLKLT